MRTIRLSDIELGTELKALPGEKVFSTFWRCKPFNGGVDVEFIFITPSKDVHLALGLLPLDEAKGMTSFCKYLFGFIKDEILRLDPLILVGENQSMMVTFVSMTDDGDEDGSPHRITYHISQVN